MKLFATVALIILALLFLLAAAFAATGTDLKASPVFYLACAGICAVLAWTVDRFAKPQGTP